MERLGKKLVGAEVLPPMTTPSRNIQAAKSHSKPSHKATRERFNVLNEFVDVTLQGLTKAEIGTWLVLYRDTRNGVAKTSQGNIAKRSGVSSRSVGKAVCKLVNVGLLDVVYQGGLNKGPSIYRVRSLRNPSS